MGRGQYRHHLFLVLQDTPVADAKPDDIKDLLGGALFQALFKWMQESGPVYLLPTGKLLSGSTCWLLAAQRCQCARGYKQLAAFNGVFDISNIYMHMGAAVRAARQDLNTQYGLLQMQFGLALADVHATSLGQHTVLHIDKHFHQSWWFTASLQSHQPAEGSAAYSNVSQIHGRLLVSNDLWQCSAQI